MEKIILAMDTASNVLSVAVSRGEKLLAERYMDCGLKHSVNLMDCVQGCLADAKVDIEEVDLFAVVAGPGSFTGIRIGVCTAQAFCASREKPGVAVNALDALAVAGVGISVCALLDARKEQVYASFYDEEGMCVLRDYAGELRELLGRLEGRVLFVGEGAHIYRHIIEEIYPEPLFLPEMVSKSRAAYACVVANKRQCVKGEEILPIYVRRSGAERMKDV